MARFKWTVGAAVFRDIEDGTMGQFWHPSTTQELKEGDETVFCLVDSAHSVVCEVVGAQRHRESEGTHNALVTVRVKEPRC